MSVSQPEPELLTPRRMVCVGGIPVDIVVRAEGLPVRGGDLRATAIVDRPGGPFTVLSTASRLGMPALYAGGHGTGARGTQVRTHLATEGIDVLRAPTLDSDTGFSLVIVDVDGERTCISTPGAEALMTASDVLAYVPRAGDAIHVTGYDLADPAGDDFVRRLTQCGPEVLVMFDPGPTAISVPPGFPIASLTTVLERADIVTLNRSEAMSLLGHADPHSVAREFPRPWTVLRDGAAGAWLLHGGKVLDHAQPPPVTVRDTTGAGDTHAGAFLAGLAEGLHARAALHLATIAAALSVRADGPGTGPTRAEISAALARRL